MSKCHIDQQFGLKIFSKRDVMWDLKWIITIYQNKFHHEGGLLSKASTCTFTGITWRWIKITFVQGLCFCSIWFCYKDTNYNQGPSLTKGRWLLVILFLIQLFVSSFNILNGMYKLLPSIGSLSIIFWVAFSVMESNNHGWNTCFVVLSSAAHCCCSVASMVSFLGLVRTLNWTCTTLA